MEFPNIDQDKQNQDNFFLNEVDLASNNISNSINLRRIIFDKNKIEYLKLSFEKSKILKKIRFYNCFLDDSKAEIIFDALKNIKTLENLDVTHNFLIGDSLKTLSNTIQINNKLKRLIFLKNSINDNGLVYISEIISKSKNLIELNLGTNKFSKDAIENILYKGLSNNYSLEIFKFSNNELSDGSIKAFCKALQENKKNRKIKEINFTMCKINDESCFHLGNLLKSNIKIENLYLDHNNITSKGLYYISEGLKMNNHIKLISFEYNFIGDLGIYHYTNSLKFNNSIHNLFLKNIIYGNFSFENISNCLVNNNHILNLDLSNNLITVKGINLICNGLRVNNYLKSISLDYCGLRNIEIDILLKTLKENLNSQIYCLSLEGNFFDKKNSENLFDLIKKNKNLKNLVLKSCNIQDDSAKVIFKALNKECEIFILDLSNNFITYESCEDLGLSLKENTKLSYLHLIGNSIIDNGIILIGNYLKQNKESEIKVLDISDMNISNNVSNLLEDIINQLKDSDLEGKKNENPIKVQFFK